MRSIVIATLMFAVMVTAPPVEKKKPKVPEEAHGEVPPDSDVSGWSDLEIEYKRYLQEVVSVLEADPKFRKKLEEAPAEDIRSGAVVQHLGLVDPKVRSQLDELKRQEVERLRHLAMQQYEQSQGIDKRHLKVPAHVDVTRHGFNEEDLHKLIKSTTKDLEEADKKRKDEFKKYEMEKKFQYDEELRKAKDEEERKKLKEEHEKKIQRHKDHPKLHHPGSKAQLEEAWEKQDHMDPGNFDLRTMFMMHDLDGNGYLDEDETKVLFFNEVKKLYDPNDEADDLHERDEELERMREHVFKETDANRDRLISLEEFLSYSKQPEFEDDPAWEGIEEEAFYTDEELQAYEQMRRQELERQGIYYPPLPGNAIDQGHHPGPHSGYHPDPNHPLNDPNHPLNDPNHPNHPSNDPNHPLNDPDHPMNDPNHPMNDPNHPANIQYVQEHQRQQQQQQQYQQQQGGGYAQGQPPVRQIAPGIHVQESRNHDGRQQGQYNQGQQIAPGIHRGPPPPQQQQVNQQAQQQQQEQQQNAPSNAGAPDKQPPQAPPPQAKSNVGNAAPPPQAPKIVSREVDPNSIHSDLGKKQDSPK
ncbi:unnamed protein product [Cyprideis torosa]|uniref:Uncharacterized protein n=1 Tax=Cyprideis torosa TaxID=163714 RepID=A0A7R8ZH17_9CRUS|nr:unnamed protein product [Cyprideis torosa]CAG0881544.1 unnamed protein product [Cyprideis torosa]